MFLYSIFTFAQDFLLKGGVKKVHRHCFNIFFFQNNPKDLDLSCRILELFWKGISHLIAELYIFMANSLELKNLL